MIYDQAFDLVRKAIAQQFRIAEDCIKGQTVAADVPGWDSFSNGMLIMDLESLTGVPLPFDAMVEATDVEAMAQIIAKACP